MKIFILSPSAEQMFTQEHRSALEAAGDLTIFSDIKPFDQLVALYEGDEPRIVAIDPDFSGWTFPNEVMDKIPNLQAICLQTTDFTWGDAQHAADKGIPVIDVRGFSRIAVAEWATFMALAVARRVPLVIKDDWKLEYQKHCGFELRGKTASVIGLGRNGTAVAENMAGLGMQVQYWSRRSEDARFKKVSLEAAVQTADIIFITIAINADTKRIVTDELLMNIRPTSILVNISDTTEAYNHDLLLTLVADGKIGGYAFEDSKDPFGVYGGNVWNGPALGWCTNESMSENARQWVAAIIAATKGAYTNRIN